MLDPRPDRGESAAPGHSGVIGVESAGLSTSGFSVLKRVDSTSSALFTAAVLGTPYATASLLFYEDILSASQPDFTLVYHNALVSSIAPAPSPQVPKEDVSFASASIQVVPEPSETAELILGVALLAGLSRRLRHKMVRA